MKSSLTSPLDANFLNKINAPTSIDKFGNRLQGDELKAAANNLRNTVLISDKYTIRETRIIDEPIENQKYCLFSFIPSSTAKPDKNDIYGMIKIRGVYNTLDECDSRCIDIIKNSDSYNKIIYGEVGHPIPITINNKYSNEMLNVDVTENASNTISENILNIKRQRKSEKDIIDGKKQFHENFDKIIKKNEKDRTTDEQSIVDMNQYITARVSMATVLNHYHMTSNMLNEFSKKLNNSINIINKFDSKSDELKNNFYDKWKQTAIDCHLKNVEYEKYLKSDKQEYEHINNTYKNLVESYSELKNIMSEFNKNKNNDCEKETEKIVESKNIVENTDDEKDVIEKLPEGMKEFLF